jgi:hypothetical protein
LVIPLEEAAPTSVGRRAAGCEVVGHHSTRFVFGGRETVGPAAALLCTDSALVDAFVVLALDVASRALVAGATWSNVLAAVEEWQTLLTPRERLSAEAEEGLWGELWFLSQAGDVDRALSAWRGPEGDATDFFVGGKSAEVKTSRQRRQHHVSQSQLLAPTGEHDAWLVSIWVKSDPVAPNTIPHLADAVLERSTDRGNALRRLLRAGYSPPKRADYTASFVILAEPEWYAAGDVPRVRTADRGVSHLRYRVSLDEARRADAALSDSLWRHFNGHGYSGAQR